MYKSYGAYNDAPPTSSVNQLSDVKKYSYDLMSSADLQKVLHQVEVIVVDAWAPWCQPCKKAGIKFELLGEKFRSFIEQKKLLLLKDNIDNEDNSYHRQLVEVVPTFFVYIQGKLVDVVTGVDFERLESILIQHFHYTPQSQQTDTAYHGQGPQRSMPQIKKAIQYPPKNM